MQGYEKAFKLTYGHCFADDQSMLNAWRAAYWMALYRRGGHNAQRTPMIVIHNGTRNERLELAQAITNFKLEIGPMFCRWKDNKNIKSTIKRGHENRFPAIVAECRMKKLDSDFLSAFLMAEWYSFGALSKPKSRHTCSRNESPNVMMVIVMAEEIKLSKALEKRSILIDLGDKDIPF